MWGSPDWASGLGMGLACPLLPLLALITVTVIRIVKAVASLSAFGMLQNMEVSQMKKGKFFFIILCGILAIDRDWYKMVVAAEKSRP